MNTQYQVQLHNIASDGTVSDVFPKNRSDDITLSTITSASSRTLPYSSDTLTSAMNKIRKYLEDVQTFSYYPLYSGVDSEDTTVAASAKSVKTVYDKLTGYNFNDIKDAERTVVGDNELVRKILIMNQISTGWMSRVGVGLKRVGGGAWGNGVISVGTEDSGTGFADFEFTTDGYIKTPRGTVSVLGTGVNQGDYLPTSGGVINGSVSFKENTFYNFRPNNLDYGGGVFYGTAGNECFTIGAKNNVTSIMLITGCDLSSSTNETWRALTPGLQIKSNCVSIGKLISDNVTPTYKCDVGGTMHIDSDLYVELEKSIYSRTTDASFKPLIGRDSQNWINIGPTSYNSDVTVLLGADTVRLYDTSGNKVLIGSATSDIREKNIIKRPDAKSVSEFFCSLDPFIFTYKSDISKKMHYGLSAQNVLSNLQKTFGEYNLIERNGVGDDPNVYDKNDDSTFKYAMKYTELIAPLIVCIQDLYNKSNEHKTKIQELEDKLNSFGKFKKQ